ncbi:terminase large subunit [Campylobacter jejuni]|uniref:terminase large subunit n=1 Tax=Campylobacter jejuni TaxID=197 RepID=UPI00069A0D18|nr:terminase TerL endonuclease subunit [Campylobacter jejuni]EAK8032572.1 terminase large subunit [Campylobacter jejuni]HEF7994612.1 terminase large subunit [Campylobacter jejuni]
MDKLRAREDILNYALAYIKQKNKEFENSPFYIDEKIAKKAVLFISLLKHTDGELAGKPFQLLNFQIEFIIDIIATYSKEKNARRYSYALLFIPRKNGKTELIGAILLYFLFIDKEKGKKIYCAANETEQAKLVFNAASSMVSQEEELNKMCYQYKTYREIRKKNAKFEDFIKVLTATSETKDGLRPYVFIYDELHAAKNGDLYKVLEEGTASRVNSLCIVISTAGYNHFGEMKKQYDYCKQVKNGIINDPSTYAKIYEPDADDDWNDEKTWIKVNPALGYGVKLEKLREYYQKALANANDEVSFKTKHLNIWTSNATSFIKDDDFLKCSFKELDLKSDVYVGLDLSATTDLTALALICEVDKILHVDFKFYAPELSARERSKRDKVPYLEWAKLGFLTLTPGNSVDYDYLINDILALNKKLNIKMIGYDPWNSLEVAKKLSDENIECVQIRQGFASISEPLKEYQIRVLKQTLNHNNNPIFRWCNSNLVIDQDARENIKPDKKKSSERIDAISALVTAIATKNSIEKPKINVYEKRGIRFL